MIYSSNKKLGFIPDLIGDITEAEWIDKYGKIVSKIELKDLYDKHLKPLQSKKSVKKKDAGSDKNSGDNK
jgi:hypothetical protein